MTAWLQRFGLHLAAAVGATGIFVAAAAVGASQTRQQTSPDVAAAPPASAARTRAPGAQGKPSVVVVTPTPTPAPDGPTRTPAATTGSAAPAAAAASPVPRGSTPRVIPERSLAGTVQQVLPDGLQVLGVGGHQWHVLPAPGALIRLNGKPAKLETIAVGDRVVILGQAQPGPGSRFLAHAITARHP